MILFGAGLLLNLLSGVLVLNQKRNSRKQRVQKETLSQSFITRQKILDHFTGREPFYILITVYWWVLAFHAGWDAVFMEFFLAGVYLTSAIALTAYFQMRRNIDAD